MFKSTDTVIASTRDSGKVNLGAGFRGTLRGTDTSKIKPAK